MPPVTDIVSHSKVKYSDRPSGISSLIYPVRSPPAPGRSTSPATNRSPQPCLQGSTSEWQHLPINPTHPSRLSSSPTSSFCDIPNSPAHHTSLLFTCALRTSIFCSTHNLPLNTIWLKPCQAKQKATWDGTTFNPMAQRNVIHAGHWEEGINRNGRGTVWPEGTHSSRNLGINHLEFCFQLITVQI